MICLFSYIIQHQDPNLPISYSFLEVDVDTLIVGSSMAFLPVEVQAVETVRMKWQLSFLYHQS